MKFLDTYALVKIVQGDLLVKKLLSEELVTFDLNLAELYAALLRLYDKKTADKYYLLFSSISQAFPSSLIPRAMIWKKTHAQHKFSYADALGYIFAQTKGVDFVTGDKEFKSFKGVLFLN
ncbi:MAG: PIN domain-containing protein, partial [Bdellovibrionales bacterium]|nr:PIN domain-containing protein [Bdellovibrionales bacterium]